MWSYTKTQPGVSTAPIWLDKIEPCILNMFLSIGLAIGLGVIGGTHVQGGFSEFE